MKKKKNEGSLLEFFQKLGPGLIIGVSDDDPSGIATYSQAVILHIANNRKIMGRFVNGFWQNCIGLICFLLMLMASLALILQFL